MEEATPFFQDKVREKRGAAFPEREGEGS